MKLLPPGNFRTLDLTLNFTNNSAIPHLLGVKSRPKSQPKEQSSDERRSDDDMLSWSVLYYTQCLETSLALIVSIEVFARDVTAEFSSLLQNLE